MSLLTGDHTVLRSRDCILQGPELYWRDRVFCNESLYLSLDHGGAWIAHTRQATALKAAWVQALESSAKEGIFLQETCVDLMEKLKLSEKQSGGVELFRAYSWVTKQIHPFAFPFVEANHSYLQKSSTNMPQKFRSALTDRHLVKSQTTATTCLNRNLGSIFMTTLNPKATCVVSLHRTGLDPMLIILQLNAGPADQAPPLWECSQLTSIMAKQSSSFHFLEMRSTSRTLESRHGGSTSVP